MQEWRTRILEKLVSEKEPAELYRLQGALKTVDEVMQLRGVVDEYIKGRGNGTMKEIQIAKPI